MLENDNNSDMALAAYEKAIDLYQKDHKTSAAKDCLLKAALIYSNMACNLAAEPGDGNANATIMNYFIKAGEIYDQVGRESMESKLGAYSAKGYFFQSLLCTLALGKKCLLQLCCSFCLAV